MDKPYFATFMYASLYVNSKPFAITFQLALMCMLTLLPQLNYVTRMLFEPLFLDSSPIPLVFWNKCLLDLLFIFPLLCTCNLIAILFLAFISLRILQIFFHGCFFIEHASRDCFPSMCFQLALDLLFFLNNSFYSKIFHESKSFQVDLAVSYHKTLAFIFFFW